MNACSLPSASARLSQSILDDHDSIIAKTTVNDADSIASAGTAGSGNRNEELVKMFRVCHQSIDYSFIFRELFYYDE